MVQAGFIRPSWPKHLLSPLVLIFTSHARTVVIRWSHSIAEWRHDDSPVLSVALRVGYECIQGESPGPELHEIGSADAKSLGDHLILHAEK